MKFHRQHLCGCPTINPNETRSLHDVKALLQSAVLLEHTTIPPYLCALYSIREGTNREAVDVILSVVMEEMLHMVLAANVMNAIGAQPLVNKKESVPEYPATLAGLDLTVNLERFSKKALDAFIEIERPDDAKPPPLPDRKECHVSKFNSIAQFYELIVLSLKKLSAGGDIFTGDPARQIRPEHYYGGGGKSIAVTDLDSALEALDEIIGQGEGIPHSIWAGPDPNPARADYLEVAHFYRFLEIRHERRYRGGEEVPGPNGKYPLPSGDKFNVNWAGVHPMRCNPSIKDLIEAKVSRDVIEKATAFNRTYMHLLDRLDSAMNGRPELMKEAAGVMYQLKHQAIELMKIPLGDTGETVGPIFGFPASSANRKQRVR